jgi:hypothetical protein
MKPDPPPAESAAPTIRDPRRHKLRHHPEVSAFIARELERQREAAQFI